MDVFLPFMSMTKEEWLAEKGEVGSNCCDSKEMTLNKIRKLLKYFIAGH
ncbi:hypothetical protein MNBD_GAMMA05-1750 [hydrothermal vent metagenome]|uniref:Uncharacterized protein n=1 Tax=hydrothermal vent metagenome TaxID=652676 RepID=A0A3B0X178_9ZZZZ